MEAIKISLGIYALAIACGFFIALVLMIMGRAVKYLDFLADYENAKVFHYGFEGRACCT